LSQKGFLKMTAPPSEFSWFALTVGPSHERRAERSLLHQGFEAYLPVYRVHRRWSDRVKKLDAVLFPGYVFCRFSYPDRLRVLNSPGVRSIVTTGRDPAPVNEDEISAVRCLLASGRPPLPWPYLRIGQKVVIRDGQFASLRGVIVRAKDSWRVVVSVEALSCSVAIEVDADLVAPDPAWRTGRQKPEADFQSRESCQA
jgi:transcription antitermination factor NusG